ncbi:MAG: hypothetical protein AAGF47_04740 [Planctomycetota bacterium]
MDLRVAERFARAQGQAHSARVRVVDLHAGLGPIPRFLLTAAGFGITLLVLLLLLAAALVLIPVILVLGLVGLTVVTVRRKLSQFGRPNASVAGVRTDGRSNVRVITRD